MHLHSYAKLARVKMARLTYSVPRPILSPEASMSEKDTYERARRTWLLMAATARQEPLLARTFGAHVESCQLAPARVVAWLRALGREILR